MLNKFLTDSPPVFDLAHVSVLGILGPDALSFANSQFMNDVTLLHDGEWQWSGWLNTKGRVVCLFALVRIRENELLVVLPDYPAPQLGAALMKLVFRAKVQLGVWSELKASGSFVDTPFTAPNALAGDFNGRDIALNMGTSGHPRVLRLATTQAAADTACAAKWRVHDVCFGLPRLDVSQEQTWTPQQLSLQNLRAFSVRKGCYPGQEIVARTHFLGKSKRELILLRDADAAQGLVCTATHDGHAYSQAVASMDTPRPPQAIAFWAGLAR